MLQQTPRAVTASPPSSVILPPLVAVAAVIEVAAVVVSVAKATILSGVNSFSQLKVITANRIIQRKVFIFRRYLVTKYSKIYNSRSVEIIFKVEQYKFQ